MPGIGQLRYLYLAYFSQPASERSLYRLIRREKPQRIVEIGIGRALRAVRMIQVAARYRGGADNIRYAGIDLFEARTVPASGMSLKEAHRVLKATAARVQLIPGDPLSALTRTANALAGTDLLIISAGHEKASLDAAWFYVPRMLHSRTRVLMEAPGAAEKGPVLRAIERSEIDALASRSRRRSAA